MSTTATCHGMVAGKALLRSSARINNIWLGLILEIPKKTANEFEVMLIYAKENWMLFW